MLGLQAYNRRDASIMDRRTSEDISQEMIVKSGGMKPANLGGLADKTLDAIYRFGEALWTELKQVFMVERTTIIKNTGEHRCCMSLVCR